VIAKPDWSDAIGDQAATGGPAVDLHIHDTHFISLIADVPQAVSSVGQVGPGGSVDYLTTSYLYGPGGPTITCSSGALAAATRPFVHGFEIYLERATLAYSSAGVPLTLYPAQGEPTTPQLEGGGDPITAFALELESAVTGVATNTMPKLLSGQLARDALVLCHKECQSVKEGRVVSMTE
jgi:predicted dehydrogenase